MHSHNCGEQVTLLEGDGEVEVDFGEHLRVAVGALGLQRHVAAAHVLAPALEDQDHVVGGAAAGAQQDHLHRARRQVVAAALGRAIHADHVARAGLGPEAHARRPVPADFDFHRVLRSCRVLKGTHCKPAGRRLPAPPHTAST